MKKTWNVIVAVLMAILAAAAYIFKRKADKAEVDAVLGETKGRDTELQKQQAEVEKQIQEMDAGIERARQEREAMKKKEAEDGLSLKERADRIKKNLQ